MKKIKKSVVSAIEYFIQNPNIPITKISKIFQVDRHLITKYKNDYFLLFIYILYKYCINKNNSITKCYRIVFLNYFVFPSLTRQQ